MSENNMDQLLQIVKFIEEYVQAGNDIKDVTVRVLEDAGVSTQKKLERLGGLNKIKKSYFPDEKKDLAAQTKLNRTNSYIGKLEKQLGSKEINNEIIKNITNKIAPIPKPKLPKFKLNSKELKRDLVVMLNDTHYGLIVDSESVGNTNSFSWKEACRRTAMVIKEAIEYKPHARSSVDTLHLVLAGDHLAGTIHALPTKTQDLFVHQMNGFIHILTHAINSLALNFKKVKVYGIGGNHDNMSHKREHGQRITVEFFDSYANIAYYALSTAFQNFNNVEFVIPKTPYVFIDLPAGRAMAVHGDSIFSKALGNPGSNVNIKSLTNEIRNFNSGEQLKGLPPIKLLLAGHTHSYVHFVTRDGVDVLNAPSLSGVDEYAHQLNINNNFIGQVLFESTKNFILGDKRLVRLNSADNDSSLDKIIPIYNKGLKWQK